MRKDKSIFIKGARQHNLKNISLEIPKDKLIFLKVISNVIKLGMNIVGVNTPEKM